MLLRLSYLALTNMVAFVRLLPTSDMDRNVKILALRHQLAARDSSGSEVTGPEAIDHVTRRIVDRILQAPSEALRRGDLSLDPRGESYLRAFLGLTEAETAEAHDER